MARTPHSMVSMEYDDDDSYDAMPTPIETRPRFPWGLCITLTEKELTKLGMDASDFEIGDLVHIFGMARVTGMNVSATENGNCCTLNLQVEDFEIESEEEENNQHRE